MKEDWICDDRGIDKLIERQKKIRNMSDEEFEQYIAKYKESDERKKVDVVA